MQDQPYKAKSKQLKLQKLTCNQFLSLAINQSAPTNLKPDDGQYKGEGGGEGGEGGGNWGILHNYGHSHPWDN